MKARHPMVISTRTDAEWPPDHPARRVARVMSNEDLAAAEVYIVCTIIGEERQPPAPDDHDIETMCGRCGVGVMHRASAPVHGVPVCWKCWLGRVSCDG